jgi:hypothetical protein
MALPGFWEKYSSEVWMLFILNADEIVGLSLMPVGRTKYARSGD